MSRFWPPWRFERELAEEETKENMERIAELKDEAEQALQESKDQVATVHAITEAHRPIRRQLRHLREKNQFAEGFRRIIEEGGR